MLWEDRVLGAQRSLSLGEYGMSHELAQLILCMGSGDWQSFASASCPIPSPAQMYHKVGHSHRAVLGRQVWSPLSGERVMVQSPGLSPG